MPKATFLKAGATLVPADDDSAEALQRVKQGDAIEVQWHAIRNYKFLRKFFAMLRIGFDHWDPPSAGDAVYVSKNFESFREQAVILAGFFEATYTIDGSVMVRAKSISFARMDESEFERVYSKVADVILERVLTNYTRDDLDKVVEEVLRFT